MWVHCGSVKNVGYMLMCGEHWEASPSLLAEAGAGMVTFNFGCNHASDLDLVCLDPFQDFW